MSTRFWVAVGVFLGALANSATADACSPRMPPSTWERSFGSKRLEYAGTAGRPTLKLYEGQVLKWSVPWSFHEFPEPFELWPGGAQFGIWGNHELTILSAKDGTTRGPIHFAELLSEPERVGGSFELQGEFRPTNPCYDGEPGSDWSLKHEAKKGGLVGVTVATAPQFDGVRRKVELSVDPSGRVTRAAPPEKQDLDAARKVYLTGAIAEDRRTALQRLVWASEQPASLGDSRTDPFFLAVARDLKAPPDFFEMAVLALRHRSGEGRVDLREFLGRTPRVDLLLLAEAPGWTADEQRQALARIVSSAAISPAERRWAFGQLTSKIEDLGELALPLAQSPDPQLRAELIAKLEQLPPSPAHLTAALAMLDEQDAKVLETARKVMLDNLAHAPPSRHSAEIAKALTGQRIKRWEEGDLALGAYLQASGAVDLAGGLFASAIERTRGQPSPVRNELINRLALNLLLRVKLAEAGDAIAGLEAASHAEVCALTPYDARIGVVPRCGRLVPTRIQVAELKRALAAAEAR